MDSLFEKNAELGHWIDGASVFVRGEAVGILKPSLMEGRSAKGEYFISAPGGIMAIRDPEDVQSVIESLIKSDGIAFGTPDEVDIINNLLKSEKWSRQTSYFLCTHQNCAEVIKSIDIISAASVLIVGCGGIGSLTSMQLAGAGIKHISIADNDTIEESNLNRQLFWTRADIGKKKVAVLKDRINAAYETECAAFDMAMDKIKLEKIIHQYDAIVVSADEPIGIGSLLAHSINKERNQFLVNCGYSQDTCIVNLVRNGENSASSSPAIKWFRTPRFIGPSFGPVNTEISAIVASIVLKELPLKSSKDFPPTQQNINFTWKQKHHQRKARLSQI